MDWFNNRKVASNTLKNGLESVGLAKRSDGKEVDFSICVLWLEPPLAAIPFLGLPAARTGLGPTGWDIGGDNLIICLFTQMWR